MCDGKIEQLEQLKIFACGFFWGFLLSAAVAVISLVYK